MKILYYQRQRCSPMTLDSDNIRFMWIFAVVLKIYVNFLRFYACVPILHIQEMSRRSCFQVQVFVTVSYQYGCHGLWSAWLAEMWQVTECDRRVFGIRRKLRIFRGRYIVRILTNKANISIYHYLVPYRLSTDSKTRDLEWLFCVKFCFALVCLELWSLAIEAWLLLNLFWMLSANFKPKTTAVASCCYLCNQLLFTPL